MQLCCLGYGCKQQQVICSKQVTCCGMLQHALAVVRNVHRALVAVYMTVHARSWAHGSTAVWH